MLQELLAFLKHPRYRPLPPSMASDKRSVWSKALGYCFVLNVLLSVLVAGIPELLELDLGEHALERMFNEYSPLFLLFAGVVLAPLVEESVFRGPMVFFKERPYFPIVFYAFTLVFAFYHITNFEISAAVLWLSPLLVSPQLIVGAIFGFVRVKLGLGAAILLHAAYNLLVIGPVVLIHYLKPELL